MPQCVYSAVRAVSLSTVQVIADAYSRLALTAEALVQSQNSPCETCCGKSGTGTSFSRSTSCFHVVIPPMLHADPYMYVALTRRANVWSLGTFQKSNALSQVGEIWVEKYLFPIFVSVFEGLTFRTYLLPTHGVYAFRVTLVQDLSFTSVELTYLSP